jgi:hypothetical protein
VQAVRSLSAPHGSGQQRFTVRLACTQKEDKNGVPLHGREYILRGFGFDGEAMSNNTRESPDASFIG